MHLITTPIPYTNAKPHLGNLLEGVFNDTVARFQRRMHDNVILTLGLDQHGLKIYEKAVEAGLTPQEFVSREGQQFIDMWSQFEVQYDELIKTESPRHIVVSQIIWQELAKKGFIFKKSYDGLYCKGCEDFYAPSQLTDEGLCPVHLSAPIKVQEENYFFKLSAFQEPILEYLTSAKIAPEGVRLEQQNFVKGGLQDISISREKSRLPWGIAVPDDESQVMYVWFEALINYWTAAINPETIDRYLELPLERKAITTEILKELKKALPIEMLYASKEIAKFHLVIFPAMHLALGLPLPKKSLCHGMINDAKGIKFSKTLGNAVFPEDMVAKFGVDGTRFIILYEINLTGDTSFEWNRMIDSYNSHLADNLGNLVVRVSNLTEKLVNGIVDTNKPIDIKYLDQDKIYQAFDEPNPQKALDLILQSSSSLNQYLENTKPWMLVKETGKEQEIQEILDICCSILKQIGQLISICLPNTGDQIYQIFNSERIVKAPALFPKVETTIVN